MRQKQLLAAVNAGLISLGLAGNADAQLLSRLGGLAYYDDQANLTWLADAEAAKGTAFDIGYGGAMFWQNANAWAAQLTVAGIGGWRLPTTLQPDASCESQSIQGQGFGWGCTGSEMGNLFHNVLGGVVDSSIVITHNANYNLFSNVQSEGYWSGTENAIYTNFSWYFDFGDGVQSDFNNGNGYLAYTWAVQSGDVGEVPVPAAVWLFGSGLLGLIGVARRKSANI